jgi:hypothetical protein
MLKFLVLFSLLYNVVYADLVTTLNEQTEKINDFTLITKDPEVGLIMDNVLVDTMIALWGKSYWKWGTQSEHIHHEEWFQQDSQTGGSDKTGHFYMTYLLSRVLSSRMQDRGYSLETASLTGSLSGLLAMTLLEVGDGTSEYGFSTEDLISDTLGAMFSYLIRSNPKVDDFIDIRLEYMPTASYVSGGDNTTDYSGMRHLVAFKLSGFDKLKNSYFSLVEFQAGFYSRGYRSFDTIAKSQHVYVGIGISLSDLARRTNINALKNLFEFYQPGGTYIDTDAWSR